MGSDSSDGAGPLANEPFRLLVQSVTDYAIFMLDPTGVVRTWNPGAHRLKQYEAEEIIGRHFSIFYPAEDVQSGKCEHGLSVAAQVGRFEAEGWRIRKDGSRFWANVIISAVRTPDGALQGFAKVTRDLTERRNAEQLLRDSEMRLRLLVESVQDYAIFMLDPTGHVTTWNTGAQNNTQYRAEEVIGRHFSLFYPPEGIQAGHPQRELDVATATGRYEEEGWRVRKNGSMYWANVVLTAIRGDKQELVGFAKVTRDLTDRKTAEREQAARLAAEDTNRAKDEFLAMLGHELRNPLAPTLTALQLMKLRGDPRTSREREVIERQMKHMIRLVDDLLDLARVTRGLVELRRDRVDLRDAIAGGIELASPLIQEKRHDLDLDLPAHEIFVEGDLVRLAQIFANLLTNAARYTNPAGRIRVAVTCEQSRVLVEVRDNGTGISADLLPRIFDRFVQAPQGAARTTGGLGIGLTLVHSFVRAHGGTVTAQSDGPGRGSVFQVTLPLARGEGTGRAGSGTPTEPAPLVSAPPADAGRARRVLMVDDNDDALVLGADIVRTGGHDVRTAGNGLDALDVAVAFVPDVAVVDIGLPDVDGYELATRLRSALGPRTPRLIAVTGYGQPSDRERSRFAGFERHLVKPVDAQLLLASIDGEPTPKHGTGG